MCNNIEETETFSSTVKGNLLKLITLYVVMINVSFTFSLAKFVLNNILVKELISLGRDGTTIKIVTEHF